MAVGQPYASKEAGLAMTFSLSKDPAQFDAAVASARAELDKRFKEIPASLKFTIDQTQLDQAMSDIHKGMVAKQRIQTQGLTAVEAMVNAGVPLEYIAQSGSRYARAGVAQIMAANAGQNPRVVSATFTSGINQQLSGTARIQDESPRVASATFKPSLDQQLSGEATIKDERTGFDLMLDKTLKAMARRGPLVAAVVASAVVSSTVGAAIMSPVVQATHGGYSPTLAQSAASQQMGLGVLRGLGSIPLVGAAFSAMASRREAEIGWAQQAAMVNATMPFQSQAMRASARGDTPAEVAATRAVGQQQMLAAQETARQKLNTMLPMGYVTDAEGNVIHERTGKRANMSESNELVTGEMRAMQKELQNTTESLKSYKKQTDSMVAVSEAVQSAEIIGNIVGGTIAARGEHSALIRASGGSPIEAMKLDIASAAASLKQSQREAIAKLPEGSPYIPELEKRQALEQRRFASEKRWELMQYTYAAPSAGIYSAGEATAQAEISSMRMDQSRQLWEEVKPLLIGILDKLGGTAYGEIN